MLRTESANAVLCDFLEQEVRHDDPLTHKPRQASFPRLHRSCEAGGDQPRAICPQEPAFATDDKVDALRRFAGGIAHNFNNLLTVILGYAQLAKGEVLDGSPAQQFLSQVESAANSLAELTAAIACFGRRGQFVVRPVSLTRLVEDQRDALRCLVPESIELSVDLSETLPLADGDESELGRVVTVLVANASEASRPGGKITIRTDDVEVDELFLRSLGLPPQTWQGRYVRLQVSDRGCGREEETRKRMFEPFFSTKFTGRGMGLAMAQAIVASHNGAIGVMTVPDVGTTFHVLLPCENAVGVGQSSPPREE